MLTSLNYTGPHKHNSTSLVSIRCVVREIRLFSYLFPGLWQGTRKHLKLDEGSKNSRISRTTQRIDTRPVPSCLQGPVQSSDINIVGLVLSQVSPHLKFTVRLLMVQKYLTFRCLLQIFCMHLSSNLLCKQRTAWTICCLCRLVVRSMYGWKVTAACRTLMEFGRYMLYSAEDFAGTLLQD